MKHIYKILFSLCSTLICTFYSARSFAASCTLLSSASNPLNTSNPTPYQFHGIDCKSQSISSYLLLLEGDHGNTYALVYDCATCNDGYIRTKKSFTVSSEAANDCTLTYYTCSLNTNECSTTQDCTDVFGKTHATITIYDTNSRPMGITSAYPACYQGTCVWSAVPSDNTAKCAGHYYGKKPTLYNANYADKPNLAPLIIEQETTTMVGCSECPTPSSSFGSLLGGINPIDIIDAGYGYYVSSCFIKPGYTFEDTSGIFTTTGGNCKYQ